MSRDYDSVKPRMTRSRKVFAAIIAVAVILIVGSFFLGKEVSSEPFGGALNNVALVQVEGTIKEVNLFCYNNECKWIVAVKVDEAQTVQEGPLAIAIPKQDEIQTVDMKDSRVNLWVKQDSKVCYEDGAVKVCTYELKADEDMAKMTYVYMETIDTSSGLPEYDGTPR